MKTRRGRPAETVNRVKRLSTREASRKLMPNVGHIARMRTGQPAHFVAWRSEGGSYKERKKVEKYLRQMTLEWLAEQLDAQGGAENLGMGRTLRKLATRYPNVLELSRSTAAEILAVDRVGKRGVETLEKYLRSKNVALTWTVQRV